MYPPGKQYRRILVYLIFLDIIKTTTSQQSGVLFVLSASGTLSSRVGKPLYIVNFYTELEITFKKFPEKMYDQNGIWSKIFIFGRTFFRFYLETMHAGVR
jgi:hypothetical protein